NPAVVVKALKELAVDDERFLLISGHGNIGFARACNLGVEQVTQNFLLLLNPDCLVTSEGIEALLDVAESLTGCWLLAPRLLNSDLSEQQGSRREQLTPWMAFVEGTMLYCLFPRHPYFKRFNYNHQLLPAEVTEVPVTSGACMLLKTRDYRNLGGMDEGYFLHVEDVDFCLRFCRSDGKIYFCPHVAFIHDSGSSDKSKLFIEWHKSRGFKRYFRKHFTGIYPPGFIGLVNLLISLRFLLLAVKELLLHPVRLLAGHKNIAG
ncbi:MAG: glycosyltransferase family 2 protein, partial [Deltaproteobacteria bacterium]